MATKTGIDTTPTDYQARLLLAALATSQHRIPADARSRTVAIMLKRQWIRARRLTTQPGGVDHVLTHHGVNAANRVRTAQLAATYPVGSGAVYVPEGATERDIVVVDSAPNEKGTVQVLSARQKGKAVRVPLAALQPLPEAAPVPEGERTEWWTVSDRTGKEVARVQGGTTRTEAMKVVESDPVAGPVSRREGGVGLRRLFSSELSIPVGELPGLPRTAPAPRTVASHQVSGGRTITVTAGFTRKSIPTRLRESGAPGRMQHSDAAGALRWVLPSGKELTPGQAAEMFLN